MNLEFRYFRVCNLVTKCLKNGYHNLVNKKFDNKKFHLSSLQNNKVKTKYNNRTTDDTLENIY